MSKQVDETLLQKYLSDTCTKNELLVIREYLGNEEYTTSLQERMAKDWIRFNNEANKKTVRYSLYRIAAAAAIVGLILGVWMLANYKYVNNDNEWLTFASETGKASALILPDSSQVSLGSASSVRYNKNYGITNRDIILEGEAYFIVDHNHEHPFNVTTGSLKTIDVGTEFKIRYIKTDPNIEVIVSKGAVDVVHNSQNIRLNQNQRLLFNSNTNTSVVDTIGGWRNGLLYFKEKTLGQVAEELRRYYNMDVRFFNEESRQIMITTSLQNATIDDAIEIISITAGVEIKRTGKIISIR